MREEWNTSYMKYCNPNTPIILVGCNTEDRIEMEGSEVLTSLKNKQISTKKGEKLARTLNATKYAECLNICETDLQDIYEEVVRTLIYYGNLMPSFRIFVVGKQNSGKTDMIRRLVYGERSNVVGKCLSDQSNFRNDDKDKFSTHIENDGEEFHLLLNNVKDLSEAGKLLPLLITKLIFFYWDNDYKLAYYYADAAILVFSVIDPDSFNAITKDLTSGIRPENNILPDYPIPIIFVGNQTDLRNDSETLNNLSEQGKEPITYEKGEQLARRIKSIKYLECSISDLTEIESVFEETVWASLRRFERIEQLKILEKAKQKLGNQKTSQKSLRICLLCTCAITNI